VPSYTRANSVANIGMTLPSADVTDVGNTAIGATEPMRKGFVGLVIRPNAYKWKFAGVRDVLAPANVRASGFPPDLARNFGPSGLSLASDRWEIRRAVVLDGVRKARRASRARAALDRRADAAAAVLDLAARNGSVYEVWHLREPLQRRRPGRRRLGRKGPGFGAMLPVGQSFTVAGEGGAGAASRTCSPASRRRATRRRTSSTVQGLQREGTGPARSARSS
jgi:hypothetical protein